MSEADIVIDVEVSDCDRLLLLSSPTIKISARFAPFFQSQDKEKLSNPTIISFPYILDGSVSSQTISHRQGVNITPGYKIDSKELSKQALRALVACQH